MNVPGLESYNWVVWILGVLAFALVIGVVIAAIVRASRRSPELHSAAERLQREMPQTPEVETKLRELSLLKERGQMGEAEYEKRRAEVLK